MKAVSSDEFPLSSEARISARRRGAISLGLIIILSAVFLVIFRYFPEWDRWPSRLFFMSKSCAKGVSAGAVCGYFPLLEDQTFRLLRQVGIRLPTFALIGLLIYLLVMRFGKGWAKGRDLKTPFWGLISGILGTVVIANWTLKDNWGRPRPRRTLDFGGDNPYVPPGDISNYCDLNCSFVSGEATAAFWLIWFAVFFTGAKRIVVFIVLTIFAFAVSSLRISFGAHYISDVLMGGCVAGLSIAFVYWFFHTRYVAAWLEKDRLRY